MYEGEERKKLSLDLHPEDSADCIALADIETGRRKNRWQLERQDVVTGSKMNPRGQRKRYS
ncbi:hypothetical protein J4X97_24040 [Escherichia coli]